MNQQARTFIIFNTILKQLSKYCHLLNTPPFHEYVAGRPNKVDKAHKSAHDKYGIDIFIVVKSSNS